MTQRRRDVSDQPDALFAPASLWQAWLDVEVALAQAQAELGIIPDWAAEGIAQVADVETLGLDRLEAEAARTMAPIHALTRVVSDRAGAAGAYVHWGATTQNVMQTGRLLLMQRALQHVRTHLAEALDHLGAMAERHAETPMIARTNRRHALPVTFGFKLAGWIEELSRAADRLDAMEARTMRLPFGGAVGAMHAFGGQGQEINACMAARLGLGEMLVPGRAVNDLFADYIAAMGLLAMSIERIARECYRLMAEELGELSETLGHSVVGSSTMPHKVNPKLVVHVIAMAGDLRASVAPGMEATLTANEGDSAANHLMVRTLDRAVPLAWRLARAFADLTAKIVPAPERMAANLALSGAQTASERLMMLMAPALGHLQAHDLLHDMLAEPGADADSIAARVAALPAMEGRISAAEAQAALDATTYVGESARIAREGAALAAALARQLREGDAAARAPQTYSTSRSRAQSGSVAR